MPMGFGIWMLVVGAVLVLAAVFGGGLFGGATSTAVGKSARAAVALAGVALMAAAAVFTVRSPAPRPVLAAVAPAPSATAPTVDLIGAANDELAGCPLSTAPAIPQGATASLAQMQAARAAFEGYDAATNAYIKCVDSAVDRVAKRYKGAVTAADLQSLDTFGRSAHNTAVDQEQAVADQFNGEVRTFKAKHPPP
jgi:hypothetical protein